MDYSVLEKSSLFSGIPAGELRDDLEAVPHRVQHYDKGETILPLMGEANRVGIILEGRAQAQKPFPNGSQVNVSLRVPGEMIGPAAAFSEGRRYPCDVVAVEACTILMFRREDIMLLMQRDIRILENFATEIASATYMLQQRLELFSYKGIAQKAACWLLIQARQTGKLQIHIPESVSNWAMMLNVSRPSLHRELKALEQEGIIAYSSSVIVIKQPDALQKILGRSFADVHKNPGRRFD
ncbi:MAG: Crp/Fnr family transcriptional regulator [Clostridia bacterium]|nr:Crp/Fnr family transcriptional regulator [Clostridia bacterium]